MELLEELPREILSWQLKGTGLDSFGTKGRPDTVPFPSYTEDNLIARIDAVGLCFSDIKLISAGPSHPRIEGRDLAAKPTVPGHEVAMTIVGVGDRWKGKFKLGSRYIIQADIYYKGKGIAFGYAIPGGLSQYVVIGREILEGDEGCYLLPVREETGKAEAALVEPWTCVIASYQIQARLGVKEKGRLQLVGFQKGQVPLDLAGIGTIAEIVQSGLSPQNVKAVEELARRTGAGWFPRGRLPKPARDPPTSSAQAPRTGSPSADSPRPCRRTAPSASTRASPTWICPWTWARCTTDAWSCSAPWTAAWQTATGPTPARRSCPAEGRGSSAAPAPWARCT